MNAGTVDFKRANKLTAFWIGDGVALATYYKTHEKLSTVRSDSPEVIGNGFVMPEGIPATEETPESVVTPQMKLEAFKNFMAMNANLFGIIYDPVDRRPDQFKFPNKYDDATFQEYSRKMMEDTLAEVVASVQVNVIDKMVAAGHLPEGSTLATSVGEGMMTISERYGSGSIKYATADFSVTLGIPEVGSEKTMVASINLVSGQLKKPRDFGEVSFTMTGIKNILTECGILPKIEKPKKEGTEEGTETGEGEGTGEEN